ncbi:hypothetical protein [Streptomyces sp. DHE17-7]|uniref:hypothetical protein n=1 Tax=Streptomyces sp. DHE17-7 TaxID=2759949 RepID=UPI0022EA2455|nr:hypothetical protein [Streptomyces sp. DHE17-7]MBJ6623674.1 hypothetical protein [Streptomyces sp. DHE17-7]
MFRLRATRCRPAFATPLNKLTDGTPVIVAGMLNEVREHGTIDAPRATLVITNDFGQAAYAVVDTDTLAEYSMCLVDGLEVTLHGFVRRPFQGDAELTDPFLHELVAIPWRAAFD